MINNHNVVHQTHFLSPIGPNLKGYTIPRFVNIDECAINEPNVTLEL
jgi:hypothetical protein